jgi:hypothetical protein
MGRRKQPKQPIITKEVAPNIHETSSLLQEIDILCANLNIPSVSSPFREYMESLLRSCVLLSRMKPTSSSHTCVITKEDISLVLKLRNLPRTHPNAQAWRRWRQKLPIVYKDKAPRDSGYKVLAYKDARTNINFGPFSDREAKLADEAYEMYKDERVKRWTKMSLHVGTRTQRQLMNYRAFHSWKYEDTEEEMQIDGVGGAMESGSDVDSDRWLGSVSGSEAAERHRWRSNGSATEAIVSALTPEVVPADDPDF